MNVLSVFGGIEAGRVALHRAGVQVGSYYSSEIDKYAKTITLANFPDVVQFGDVTKWREWDLDWSSIDLFIGGSPCQGFSAAGKQGGTKAVLNGVEILVSDRETYLDVKAKGADFLSQSHLFWEYILILDHIRAHNPNVKFLLENVKMKKELLAMIDDAIGVKSVVINSALVSAQNRVRHYWCNWEVTQPEDKGILLKDVLEDGMQAQGGAIRGRYNADGTTSQKLECNGLEKTNTLTTVQKDNVVIFRPCELRENSKPSKDNLHHIADAIDIKGNESIKRVYSPEGKAPTLTTMGGGHREPKVLCGIEQNHRLVYRPCDSKNLAVRATVQKNAEHCFNGKVPTLTAAMGLGGGNVPLYTDKETAELFKGKYIDKDDRLHYRKLTPLECERLQTFPDGYTAMVSNTQRYKSLGNSWTVDVIAHIFGCMKNESN